MPSQAPSAEKRLRQLEHQARYGTKDARGMHLDHLVVLDHETNLCVEWMEACGYWRYWTGKRVVGRNTLMLTRNEARAVLRGPDA